MPMAPIVRIESIWLEKNKVHLKSLFIRELLVFERVLIKQAYIIALL
jgi:hypothetical protein